ncbi:helix-turn-helix domain-containing protein [Burkholderia ambifaria]|uniref:helix-turn-helix domain-containing protein n=1 Tax=Burkholderia ambifaria TaxID=152480 RepID=UPI00158931BF|nr:AraC family transcriptional regulator [Burkholderia ambifaria]
MISRLLDSRAPIADIANRVGYTSEAAFSRAFRGRYEMSPMQWRRANTEQVRVMLGVGGADAR